MSSRTNLVNAICLNGPKHGSQFKSSHGDLSITFVKPLFVGSLAEMAELDPQLQQAENLRYELCAITPSGWHIYEYKEN